MSPAIGDPGPGPEAGVRVVPKARERPTHRVTANGLSIGYDEHGRGPTSTEPIVLLHGATSSGREDWAAQVPLLSRTCRLLLPDARGHATTPWDVASGWSDDWLVDDLAAFLDALGIARAHLAGFSMGGHTALAFAMRAPERVASLVLAGVSTQPEPRTSVARRLMDPARADRDDPAWGALLAARHDPFQGEGAWRRLLPAIAAEIARAPVPSPQAIHAIEAPALVAVGDRDPFVPVDHAWGLSRLLPRGRLLVVPDCPHEVTVRRPALFNEALAGFYRGILSA